MTNAMFEYDLMRQIQETPDFWNWDTVEEHLKESKISRQEYFRQLHEATDLACEKLWKSASEEFRLHVVEWYRGNLDDGVEPPEGIDREKFAHIVSNRVYKIFKESMEEGYNRL